MDHFYNSSQSENAVFQISQHYLDFPFCCSLFFFYHKRKLRAKKKSFKIILTAVYKSFEYIEGKPRNQIPTSFPRCFTLSLTSYSFCNWNVIIDFRCLCYLLFFLCVTNDNGSPTRTIHQTIEETPWPFITTDTTIPFWTFSFFVILPIWAVISWYQSRQGKWNKWQGEQL